jgi:peptide/nickel transport system ATP-binding protein
MSAEEKKVIFASSLGTVFEWYDFYLDGAMPRLNAIPQGCAFNPRCPQAFERCRQERPDLLSAGANRAACWLHTGGAA